MATGNFHDAIAAGAYRRLGLSGAATQSQVDAAARRMRLWDDPARISPTPWDLPELGPLSRTRADIEQAVATLANPITRLQERLTWYCGAAVPERSDRRSDFPSSFTLDQAVRLHDLAVAALHRAANPPPNAVTVDLWRDAFRSWKKLCAQPTYILWSQNLEHDAGFEKRAGDIEVSAAITGFPRRIATAMLAEAEAAIDRDQPEAALAHLSVLCEDAEASLDPDAARHLLDCLEDGITVAAAEMDKSLRARLLTNHSRPAPYFQRNAEAAYFAKLTYKKSVEPRLRALQMLGKDDPGRVTRVRVNCAVALAFLAMAWEWGGEYRIEETTLQDAMELARGTIQEKSISAKLAAASRRAKRQRWDLTKRIRLVAPGKPTIFNSMRRQMHKPRKAGRMTWGLIVAFFVIGRIVTSFSTSSSDSSPPTQRLETQREFNPDDGRDPVLEKMLRDGTLKAQPRPELPPAGSLNQNPDPFREPLRPMQSPAIPRPVLPPAPHSFNDGSNGSRPGGPGRSR